MGGTRGSPAMPAAEGVPHGGHPMAGPILKKIASTGVYSQRGVFDIMVLQAYINNSRVSDQTNV